MTNKQQWQAEQAQFNDTSRYNDIMDVPRHISRAHLPMTKQDRAGQFAPFAALTGYRELLDKAAQRYANKRYPTGKEVQAIFAFFRGLPMDETVTLELTYFNGKRLLRPLPRHPIPDQLGPAGSLLCRWPPHPPPQHPRRFKKEEPHGK
ncbi:MAG: hypothetical protein ACLSH6_02745 [Limosilactobacillus pontis]